MTADPSADSPSPTKPRWAPLRWLLLGALLALSPAVLVEICLGENLTFWKAVSVSPASTTDAGRALRFESDLKVIGQNFSGPREKSNILLVGNSVIASNVVHSTIRTCCGANTRVARAAVTRLTMVETAMLGPTLVEMNPALVVLSMNRWDMAGTDEWEALRWYNPGVAWRMSEPGEMMSHRSTHLVGLLGQTFLLFRHRQALLQWYGKRWGLPLGSMLDLAGGKPWTDQEIRSAEMPTVETRALQDLAHQFTAADIRLLLISAPTRELVEQTAPDEPMPLAQRLQPGLERHLRFLSEQYRFAFSPHTAFPGYTPEMFADSIHLRKPGREQFTVQLSAMVQQVLQADITSWPSALSRP